MKRKLTFKNNTAILIINKNDPEKKLIEKVLDELFSNSIIKTECFKIRGLSSHNMDLNKVTMLSFTQYTIIFSNKIQTLNKCISIGLLKEKFNIKEINND